MNAYWKMEKEFMFMMLRFDSPAVPSVAAERAEQKRANALAPSSQCLRVMCIWSLKEPLAMRPAPIGGENLS
jgi:hypothetical protein